MQFTRIGLLLPVTVMVCFALEYAPAGIGEGPLNISPSRNTPSEFVHSPPV